MSEINRLEIIFADTEETITLLRLIRNRVQKGKHIDSSDFDKLRTLTESLRHHSEMHNQERLLPKTK